MVSSSAPSWRQTTQPATRPKLVNFNRPSVAASPRASQVPCWRKTSSSSCSYSSCSYSSSSSSPPQLKTPHLPPTPPQSPPSSPSPPLSWRQSPPTTRPSSADSASWDVFGAHRLAGRQAPKRVGGKQVLECIVGRVVRLPAEALVPTDSVAHKQLALAGNPWDHPQVITKTWMENGVELISLRPCTSFGGQGIAAKKEEHQHYFTEADASQLTSESDAFNKQTYVNCSPGAEFDIEFCHVTVWPGVGKNAIQFSPAALGTFNRCERVRQDSHY